ncbi:MAG: alpha-L-arabinofuranosidase C-terminal domain-containing protein [Eubacteriales bacterium]|nr:alpha-L-arabinofuranosidase C-terminal domain-containing protein [Eubacteriales bacterium]
MDKIFVSFQQSGQIQPELHGQFLEHLGTCIDGGIWVGEDSTIANDQGLRHEVVAALERLAPPLVRWPGGCFADTYHWRDGIGPRDKRPATYNANFGTHTIEKNGFGTHEFMALCRRIGAKPWLNVNMLSGTVAEMVEWAEYCNRDEGTALAAERKAHGDATPFAVDYWGIGNESWAGGGNYTPEGYVAEYRKYATAFPGFVKTSMKDWMTVKDPTVLIAVGPDGNKPLERVQWTKRLFKAFADFRQPRLHAIDLHFYNWNIETPQDTVTTFNEADWYRVLAGAMEIESVIHEQYRLIEDGLAEYPVVEGPFAQKHHCDLIIGEWGNWHSLDPNAPSALWQQSTIRDALTTAITLDIFHRNCDKLKAACVAQTVNVLNALILTDGEATILTPSYHVFDLYKVHRNGQRLDCDIQTAPSQAGVPETFGFASEKAGIISVNIIHADMRLAKTIELSFAGHVEFIAAQTLHSDSPLAFNSAENPNRVCPRPAQTPEFDGEKWLIEAPAASVSVYQFRRV